MLFGAKCGIMDSEVIGMSAKTCFYRIYQMVMGAGMAVLPWRRPQVYQGEGALGQLKDILAAKGAKKPLIVASRRQSGEAAFQAAVEGLDYALYTGVTPNPTVDTVEEIAAMYRAEGCDSFVAIGGGSPMDAAKVAAGRIVRPGKSVAQMKGLFKIMKKLPPFIAVPTTAGTGSETTIAAVITDADHHKYAISDLSLVPHAAILDPALTVSLPAAITAQTGMDTLTHAVEAYTNRYYNSTETRRMAAEAVADIFRYLPRAVENGADMEAREKMLLASYKAGVAFTRACVGNVHAMAHTLGGLYGVSHGLANAVILPHILEDYGEAAEKELSRLAEVAGVEGGAAGFVRAIRKMNEKFGIPTGFDCIEEKDLPQMAAWAYAEANPLYPCPKIYEKEDFIRLMRGLKS